MKVWLDLSNSPHPLLFAPIARRLEELGHSIAVTARDNAQTVELARERWDRIDVVGDESPAGRGAKGAAMARRVRDLAGWARRERPDVALSHNSYGQILAARSLGIPSVTAMDFEHQRVNHLAFRVANRVLLPRALEGTGVRRQGAADGKTQYYDGLKEEIYLADFEPDPSILATAGIDTEPDSVLVVARTPPSRAIYHQFGNPLFFDALRAIGQQPDAACVVLVRHPEQREAIEALELPNVTVPAHAIDSRSLMRAADVVLGAGGTMTREAALLGVPTFSLFAGATPAVDTWLEQRGALSRLERVSQLVPVRRRPREPHDLAHLRNRGEQLVDVFVTAVTDISAGSAVAA
jgi:predicted glycosyltransferase